MKNINSWNCDPPVYVDLQNLPFSSTGGLDFQDHILWVTSTKSSSQSTEATRSAMSQIFCHNLVLIQFVNLPPQCAYVITLQHSRRRPHSKKKWGTFLMQSTLWVCWSMEVCVHLQRAFLPIHCRHVCQQNLAMPVELRPSPVFERGCEIRFCKMRARGLCLSSQLRASRWFMAWECHPATSLCPENPMYSVYSFHLILLHKISRMLLWAFSG